MGPINSMCNSLCGKPPSTKSKVAVSRYRRLIEGPGSCAAASEKIRDRWARRRRTSDQASTTQNGAVLVD